MHVGSAALVPVFCLQTLAARSPHTLALPRGHLGGRAGFICEVHGYSPKTNDITALASFGGTHCLSNTFFRARSRACRGE